MKKASNQGTSSAKLIKEFLRDGITVTVGGVPIMITLGHAKPQVSARPADAKAAKGAAKVAAQAPKRRKLRRRKSKRPAAPDPRDIRGFLATQMEGSTLTALAQHFKVKRPLMKRMLHRMIAKKEITLFKGAFFNNKRLRQRRIPSRYAEAPPTLGTPQTRGAVQAHLEDRMEVPEVVPVVEAAPVEPPPEPEPAPEPIAEAQPITQPVAVPDPEPEEPQTPESLPYPERNAA